MTVNTATTMGQVSAAERARFVVEHSSDVISVHTPDDWTYVDVNPAIVGIMGFEPHEVLGKPALDFFHPEDAEVFRTRTAQLVYSNGVYTKQYRLRHKDGHYFWVESTHRSIRDPGNGKLLEIICVTRDLSARVKAEQENRRLTEVVQSSTDLVLFFDHKFRILYSNESAEQAFGASVSGKLSDIMGEDKFALFTQSVWPQVLVNGRWAGHVLLPFGLDKASTAVLHQVLATGDDEGDILFAMLGHDLTDLLRAQEDIRKQKADISKISRQLAVGEMATVLAHEVNQPLGAIANYAHGAMRHFAKEQSSRATRELQLFEKIAHQADRAGEIIQRLRSIVGRTVYQESIFSINDLCQRVATMLEEETKDAGVSVVLDLEPASGSLRGDRIQIEQVLINLIQNAVQSLLLSRAPQAERLVVVRTQSDDASLMLSVRDTGGGILPDKLEGIFESFHTTREAGLGLGLAIARSIIEAHRGSIWATSDGTAGAEFHIRLPLSTREPIA